MCMCICCLFCLILCIHVYSLSFFITSHSTYTYNDRRYGHYQPDGYGRQFAGQKHPNQYPQGVPLGEDKFKYDPVGISHKMLNLCRHFIGYALFVRRTIHKMFKLLFRVFWEDGVKIYKENKDVTH